jgi:cytochrome c peroxidase
MKTIHQNLALGAGAARRVLETFRSTNDAADARVATGITPAGTAAEQAHGAAKRPARARLWVRAAATLWMAAFGTDAVVSEALAAEPAAVRAAAVAAGLRPLADVPLPPVDNLGDFVNPGSELTLIRLGKALFWDMQVGSDGQACGTCHFHAGADSRAKNQLSPGLKHTNPLLQNVFGPTGSGAAGGPNYTLVAEDFPFHRLFDPEKRHSRVLFDTDDVASSQGVFNAAFTRVVAGQASDVGTPVADATFQVGGLNVRRVEPRNTPTMINAVFNFANFWDGRAHNVFNGASPIGPLDEAATVLVNKSGRVEARKISIPNSSLASQAVGPPGSDLEMSFFGRPFRDVGRKLLTLRPLGLQLVHPSDSVLGSLSRASLSGTLVKGKPGLATTYGDMIKAAFQRKYWSGGLQPSGYTQIELNFPLFFGLAVQAYEATLVSDASPFDAFMAGDDAALSAEELHGLLAFINRGTSTDPVFEGVGVGNCVSCHGGAEFTDAAFSSLAEDGEDLELIEVEEMPDANGNTLFVGDATAFLDNGYSNIGVRPSEEDLGRGGIEGGHPLAFARQALAGLSFAPELPSCGGPDDEEECPEADRVAVDGAFKVPGLRNVELTGPYFHNGGQATLTQVLEFYDRQADFSLENLADLDRNIARIDFEEIDEEPLVEFLLTLTDERVRNEEAPFDHPQLFVPNGHPGNEAAVTCNVGIQSCDDAFTVPPIGAGGRSAAGLEPIGTFLALEHLEEEE